MGQQLVAVREAGDYVQLLLAFFLKLLAGFVNADEEKAKILAELEHQRKFLAGVRAKLGNERFVAHAPEAVVAVERKKEADALARIEALETALANMN